MNNVLAYFAYGSNMNIKQMQERCPGSKPLIPAVLKDYRLTERKYADIDPEPGSCVHGVMCHITKDNLESLDICEGYPRFYNRILVDVETVEGETYTVQTYIMTPEMKAERDGIPYAEDYRERCSEGAKQWHIPNEFEKVSLITYGTLMRGECNHRLVQFASTVKPCVITGTLYDTGFGFPAFTQDGDTPVKAEFIRIPRSKWGAVDRLEGYPDLYTRKFIVAKLADGSTVGGWVYIMNALPPHAKVIKSGDWKARA